MVGGSKKRVFWFMSVFLAFACASAPEPKQTDLLSLSQGLDSLAEEVSVRVQGKGAGIRMAVIPFLDLKNNPIDLGAFIAEGLTTRMCGKRGFEVIERAQIDQIFKELEFSVQDLVDEDSAQEVGRLLGVEDLLIGTVTDLGNRVGINSRLIEAETGKVLAASSVEVKKDESFAELMKATEIPAPSESSPGQGEKQTTAKEGVSPRTGKDPSGADSLPQFLVLQARALVPIRKGSDLKQTRKLALERAVRKAAVDFLRQSPRWQNLPRARKEQLVRQVVQKARVEVIREGRERDSYFVEVRLTSNK